MENNVLDEFEINKNKNEIEKSSNQDKNLYIFFSGIAFGFGYLMVLINGYYHLKSIEFIQIGREDLIARLGYLAYSIGFIFYPTSIILTGIIIWIINKRRGKGMLIKLSFSVFGLIVPGILFYGDIGLDILFGPKEKWIIGVVLIILSAFILLKKRMIIKKNKSAYNNR